MRNIYVVKYEDQQGGSHFVSGTRHKIKLDRNPALAKNYVRRRHAHTLCRTAQEVASENGTYDPDKFEVVELEIDYEEVGTSDNM